MTEPQKHTFLICNAHLDPVWLWEWEEGAAAAISTFRTAADLCEQFGAFVFNHNEAILYRWVEELDPGLFARIQRLVKEGRWHIMGGWYLQPDCNMPSGESFVRQILLGRRYFAEKFAARPTTAINFDPFGHTRGLVQIMARSGFDSYIFCRPRAERLSAPRQPCHRQRIPVGGLRRLARPGGAPLGTLPLCPGEGRRKGREIPAGMPASRPRRAAVGGGRSRRRAIAAGPAAPGRGFLLRQRRGLPPRHAGGILRRRPRFGPGPAYI